MKIGVFDSGYGGLTILDKIRHHMPQYDYLYLGDNARAPYGSRSFECIYRYTLQAVQYLQQQGCLLIILACNTASAKALRTIQQHDIDPAQVRVLGVIRPTVEAAFTNIAPNRHYHFGILATSGTVQSESYCIELEKQFLAAGGQLPFLHIAQQACPLWVPLIESGEHNSAGADYFVHEYLTALLKQDPEIDTILLGCTHYPLLQPKIEAELRKLLPERQVHIVAQGDIVAQSLQDYLHRHQDIEACLSRGASCTYLTTDSESKFSDHATIFLSSPVSASRIVL